MSRELRQGEALDVARSAKMACANDAGPSARLADWRVAGAGARFGRHQPQQFAAIEEDLKE